MSKREYPPLLPPGFHPMGLPDLRTLCVNPFPRSKTREAIMSGLEKLFGLMAHEGIVGEAWVDGSFLTEKLNPNDSDVALRLQGSWRALATSQQRAIIRWFAAADLKPDYLCDSYIFYDFPAGHALHGEAEWDRAYWIKQFGFSRGEEYKGIVTVQLP